MCTQTYILISSGSSEQDQTFMVWSVKHEGGQHPVLSDPQIIQRTCVNGSRESVY